MPPKFYPRPKIRTEETMDHRWKQSKGKAHVVRDAGQIKLLLKGGFTKEDMALMYVVDLEYIKEIFGKEGRCTQ